MSCSQFLGIAPNLPPVSFTPSLDTHCPFDIRTALILGATD